MFKILSSEPVVAAAVSAVIDGVALVSGSIIEARKKEENNWMN